jgi:putative membrane protein
MLEPLLAAFHITAILTMVVFLTSEAVLCRPQWMNAAVVERLVRVDRIYGIAAVAVLGTGIARVAWGAKGAGWYAGNPLLHVKAALFIAMALLSIKPTLAFRRWMRTLREQGTLPADAQILAVRRLVMAQAHLVPVIAVVAVFFARGFGK